MKKKVILSKLQRIFKKHNLPNNHSRICADYLLKAELINAQSHGLARLKMYCDRLKKGLINSKPKIKIKRISSSISHINADNSIGFVAAPHGAKKSLFGTNPICFGAPTGNTPFIFDSSASMINRGKIRRAEKLGLKIPFGVALNKKGKITTDAKQALQGTQLPIAEFKGSGLAWMVDILSGVLTGSSHGGKTKDPFDDFSGPQNVGHLFITINPNVFSGNSFLKEMKKNIKLVKKLPKAKGFSSIMYPGERKNKIYKKNINKDISIPSKILKEMEDLDANE